jgi:hypothetical protein
MVLRMNLLDSELMVWIAREILARAGLKPIAEAGVPKDRYIAPGGLEARVLRPVADREAEREDMAVFGPGLAEGMTRNVEKPGGSLILVTRAERVEAREPELERLMGSLRKQRRYNRRIFDVRDQVDPNNAGTPEFFV